MPRYRDTFKLNPNDIDLIEQALRDQAAGATGEDAGLRCPRAIQDLLGRLHAQKIFYSQARTDGFPSG
jgi:hypothetical protein